jgi:uncharacterized protein involved in exopolysaccharide biosynthesis
MLIIVFRYKKTSVVIFTTSLIIAALSAMTADNKYVYSTKLLINTKINQPRLNLSDQQTRMSLCELINTELEYIKSDLIINAAIHAYNTDLPSAPISHNEVLSGLSATSTQNSSIIELAFRSRDENQASNLLRHVLAVYLRARTGNSNQDTREVNHYQGLLNDINARIDSLSHIITDGDFFANLSLTNEVRAALTRDLSEINTQFQAQRVIAEKLDFELEQLKCLLTSTDYRNIPTPLLEDEQLLALCTTAIKQEQELQTNSQFVADSRPMQILRNNLDRTNQAIGFRLATVQQFKQSLAKDIAGRMLQLQDLRKEIEHQMTLNSKNSIISNNMNNSLSDLVAVRTVLVRQLEEATMRANQSASLTLEVLDYVNRNSKLEWPIKSIALIVIPLIGLLTSLLIPFYLNAVSGVILTSRDVEKHTGLKTLSIVNEL